MRHLAGIAGFALLLVTYPVSAQVWVPANPVPNQPNHPEAWPGQGGQKVPVSPSADSTAPAADAEPVTMPVKDKDSRLSPDTRLELIRYVSGEFAKAKTALPGGKKALHVRAGQPPDQKELIAALKSSGVAVSPGDDVQITKLDFGDSDITVEINGGGNGGKSWRDRIQISGGGGGGPGVSTSSTVKGYGDTAPEAAHPGTTVQLDFERPLPEMTPDELKLYLSTVLDFSKQRSAAVQWVDSQPPEVRQAIVAKRATVGMDEDQVIAALGRADRKVRERQPDGTETEDWIYGQPPGKTIFVRFAHEKVIRVNQYPLPVASAGNEQP